MWSTLRQIVLPVLVLVLAGCGAPAAAPTAAPARSAGIIVGYSAPGLVGAQLDIQQSLERNAREKGWQLITTTSGGDAAKQITQIENYIALGVNAIVAVPDDSTGICAAVEKAKAAGIPFYTIDRAPQGCTINMAVLSDNYLAGKQSAEELVAQLTRRYGEPRGTLLEITGNMAQNVAQLRGGGFQAVIKQYPAITLITREGDWDHLKGAVILREVLAGTPDLDGVYVHSDAVYFEELFKTLDELGRLRHTDEEGAILLAGVDGGQTGVQAVRDGYAVQVSNQPIPDFGIVVRWIEQELEGTPITPGEVTQEGALWSPARIEQSEAGPQLFLATTSVTKANVDDPRLWANQ